MLLEKLKNTKKLSDINQADYDAVFYPGGHGPLWDLAEDKTSIALIEAFYTNNKPVGFVCHAPGALKNVKVNGEFLVKGKKVTGFSNTEEEAVGLTKVVPFLLEDALQTNGATYSKVADWHPYAVEDGLLITGQNPASSKLVAEKIIRSIKCKKIKMLNFELYNPTNLVFGKGQIEKLSTLVPEGAKIMLAYGGGSIFKNGIHEQVINNLKGFEIVEFSGIEANPHFETLMKAVAIVKEQNIDFILAVGGGSVIDGVKFISAAANFDGNPIDILQKRLLIKDLSKVIPFGTVSDFTCNRKRNEFRSSSYY